MLLRSDEADLDKDSSPDSDSVASLDSDRDEVTVSDEDDECDGVRDLDPVYSVDKDADLETVSVLLRLRVLDVVRLGSKVGVSDIDTEAVSLTVSDRVRDLRLSVADIVEEWLWVDVSELERC